MIHAARIDQWLDALHGRHVAPWRPQEFTRALRALSVRYVERRGELPDRSPLDSAGKRAAFAAFYAPLHFVTLRAIFDALPPSFRDVRSVTDLGCGTGVGAAAWAAVAPDDVRVTGLDLNAWAVEEANWNWRTLGLHGRATRGDMGRMRVQGSGVLCAWSVNELTDDARARLLPDVLACARAGSAVLIVEPLAKAATPWWPAWQRAVLDAGGRADEWKFPPDLPPALRELSARAGFRRDTLGARTLAVAPSPAQS